MRERIVVALLLTCCVAALLPVAVQPRVEPHTSAPPAVHGDAPTRPDTQAAGQSIRAVTSAVEDTGERRRFIRHGADRIVDVRVVTHAHWPEAGALVSIERQLPHGPWVETRRLRTDAHGRASFRLPDDKTPRRVRLIRPTPAPSAPPTHAILSGSRRLWLRTAAATRITLELVDFEARPLLGAQSATLQIGARSFCCRLVSIESSMWQTEVPRSLFAPSSTLDATAVVTDSLGRPWRRAVTLHPGGRHAIQPPDTASVLRGRSCVLANFPLIANAERRPRLRWSLATPGAKHEGAAWLPDGGFHAVAPASDRIGDHAVLDLHATSGACESPRQRVRWPLAMRSVDVHTLAIHLLRP